MFSLDYVRYSAEYLKKAVALARAAGLEDNSLHAGEKSFVKDGLSVLTGRGEMIAYGSYEDDEYPGIAVDIELNGNIIGLVTSEVVVHEGNAIFSRVFANLDEDEITHNIEHTGETEEVQHADKA